MPTIGEKIIAARKAEAEAAAGIRAVGAFVVDPANQAVYHSPDGVNLVKLRAVGMDAAIPDGPAPPADPPPAVDPTPTA